MASRHGHTHLVRLLLDHGADVNLPSRGGVGPLHLAARFGHSATVELLLDKGNRNGTLVSIFGLCLTVFPTLACLRPNGKWGLFETCSDVILALYLMVTYESFKHTIMLL